MPWRAASSAAPAAVPANHVCDPPIYAPLFEGDSDDNGDHNTVNTPAVLISPVKAQAVKQGIANKHDIEVWDLPDSKIIGVWLFF